MYSNYRKSLHDHELEHRVALAILRLRPTPFRYFRSAAEGTLRLEGSDQFLEIQARDGEVRLFGQVRSEREKALLEAAAPRVDGVERYSSVIDVAVSPSRYVPTLN